MLLGFHDAIGDAITLSLTPKHLQGLGLIQKSVDDTAHDINFLFTLAMDKVKRLKHAMCLNVDQKLFFRLYFCLTH